MAIRFKEARMEAELDRSDARLRTVLIGLEAIWPGELTVTCVERDAKTRVVSAASPPPGSSPHEARPCRAADVRTNNLLRHQVQILAARANDAWEYDPARPKKVVALVEDDHLHVQVHPATRPRPPKPEVA